MTNKMNCNFLGVLYDGIVFQTSADNTAQELCTGLPRGEVDKEAGRKALTQGVGGENIILEILEEASQDDKDTETVAKEKLTSVSLFVQGFPIFLSPW